MQCYCTLPHSSIFGHTWTVRQAFIRISAHVDTLVFWRPLNLAMAAQTLWSNKTILELEVKIYSEKNNLQTRVTVLDLPSRSFATLLGEMLNKMSSMPAGSWMVDELEMHFKQDYLAPLMYGFKVQIIGILEEIDSFYWPKLHLWKGDKRFG